jgi:hypothetical protein
MMKFAGRGDPAAALGRPTGPGCAMAVGLGILLIAVGAVLLALTARSLHIVGIILIVAGVLVLLSALARAMLSSSLLRSRWVSPAGTQGYEEVDSDTSLDEIRRAAESDVAEMQDGGQFVSPDAPGRQEDDL